MVDVNPCMLFYFYLIFVCNVFTFILDPFDNSVDFNIAALDFGSLSYEDIDTLDNIDETDLLNYNNSNSYDQSSFLLNTPPETPNNYVMHTDNLINSSLNDSNFQVTTINSPIDVLNVSVTSNSSINSFPITQTNIGQINASPQSCLPQTMFINCQPILSNIDLNGFKRNGISTNFSKNANNHSIGKNNIQPKTILPGKISPSKLTDDSHLSKKQKLDARKVRNRESALNSRLKKKEYLENLETEMKKLSKENLELSTENKLLKEKIKDLEFELSKLKNTDINGNYESNRKKVKMSFFAVLCIFCFQVSPYLISIGPNVNNNTKFEQNDMLVKLSVNGHQSHIGRNLLWSTDSDLTTKSYYKLHYGSDHSNSSYYANLTKSVLCKDYFNKTESLRLENELRDWLTRFNLEKKQLKRKSKSFQLLKSIQNSKKLLYDSKHVPIPRLKLWMQKQKYMDYLSDEFIESTDQMLPLDFDNIMTMVHRRDDTFYYLSYPSKGHLILPPISNRTDIRPRFSFLIPTYYNLSLDSSLNISNSDTNSSMVSPQLFMLQIDCQVINTKVTLINSGSQYDKNKKVSGKKMSQNKLTQKFNVTES